MATIVNYGSGQTPPVVAASVTESNNGLSSCAFEPKLIDKLFKLAFTRIAEVDAEDNAVSAGAYVVPSRRIDLTMTQAPTVQIPVTGLINAAVADGLIVGQNYVSATRTLTLTNAAGGSYALNMAPIIADATAPAGIFPTGGIIMWSGSIASIPAGWALCNGTLGTPNLEDRFVVGAGAGYAVNAQGGSISHNHGGNTAPYALTVNDIAAHDHLMVAPGVSNAPLTTTSPLSQQRTAGGDTEYVLQGGAGSGSIGLTSSTGAGAGHSHGINSSGNLPPYYALAFIMKL
jgi:microcystin-dependent protein